MDVLVLNTSFEVIKVIDDYETLIWAERYSECGDFELYLPITNDVFSYIKNGNYLYLNESDRMMIIESIQLDTDAEVEPLLFVSGRSLESILDRRIVWGQFSVSGQFGAVIQQLIQTHVTNPTIAERKINNFAVSGPSSEDYSLVNKDKIDLQCTGDNIYDIVSAYCSAYGIGFKVFREFDYNRFKFQLYAGKDRSYEQDVNPYVIFSPDFDNLLSSKYIESKKNLKTAALVAGEGEGVDRKKVEVERNPDNPEKDLERRELFVDARDISSTGSKSDGSTYTIDDTTYNKLLTTRGNEKLLEFSEDQTFDCSIEPDASYKLNSDYFLGDIVQIVNEYGLSARARVTEVIRSVSNSKVGVYPTFTKIE